MSRIILESSFQPSGDQPQAITAIKHSLDTGNKDTVLLGVTGSGKTFTMANVIQQTQRPTLIMAPNKTLASQLYQEMQIFFPNNAVEYFVSYYDYYQPEAYIAKTDTYIEKESSINEAIDRMRHSATRSLLERPDVIIIASVSCIYGIGDVELYGAMTMNLNVGEQINMDKLCLQLSSQQYSRNNIDFSRGCFRVSGDTIDIFPSHLEDKAWKICLFGDEIDEIQEFDPLTGKKTATLSSVKLYSNSHYVIPKPTMQQSLIQIKQDLDLRITEFEQNNQLIEAQRISERTKFDIEMMDTTGICPGIENYSRYFTNRPPGHPPPTLFEYLPPNALLIVDESHVGVPQIGAMYKGDAARKNNLAEFGFRLPACRDNRPLKFDEWDKMRPQTIFVSATPGKWELERTNGRYIEQIIRPTGLLDPVCIIKPTKNQVDDLIFECKQEIKNNRRVLVTTLTKKMAESLTEYLQDENIKSLYIHSDVKTLERIEIINKLRLGEIDVLIGINLLREGLDIPECSLVVILDADKEGYLRSKTSLIQTIGRAARNVNGRAILYADNITNSIKSAIEETQRRREKQQQHNDQHGINPQTIKKSIIDLATNDKQTDQYAHLSPKEINNLIQTNQKQMLQAAENFAFEEAIELRDKIKELEKLLLQ